MSQDRVKKILNKINERLAFHGGGVDLVNFDPQEKVIIVKLQGACSHCPMAQLTSENFIKKELKRELPDLKEIKMVV